MPCTIEVRCPNCHSNNIIKAGFTGQGKQRYLCKEIDYSSKTFLLNDSYQACFLEIKKRMIDMAINGSGIRDTARVLKMSPNSVIQEIKKKRPQLTP
jgi:transposase-like protein